MQASLHFFTTTSPTSKHEALFQAQFPSFACKILINPSKKSIPRDPLPLLPQSPSQPSRYPLVEPMVKPERVLVPREPNYPVHFNPFQKLAAIALDKIETSVIMPLEKNHELPKTIDPTVQMSGNFAPVPECPVQHGLAVVGQVPACLRGVYARNGANPMFAPSGGHHLFDGDGMIHAVSLGLGNKASYSCRYTRTSRLVQEAQLGRSLFPKPIGELHGHLGLARLGLFMARVGVGLVDGSHGTGDADLETIGRFNFDDQIDCPLIAHPKVDPATSELHTLSYNVLKKPYLKYIKFDKFGKKSRDIPLSEMIRGGSPVVYDKKKTSRFGILQQNDVDGSRIQWVDVPNCFCFHLWNAWEENSDNGDKFVVVIGSCMNPPDSIFNESNNVFRSELSEIRMNLRTGESTQRVIISGINLEAGQVNRQYLGRKTRFVYLAIAEPWPKCSGIAKVDLETGQVTKFMYGARRFGGETLFVPEKKQKFGCNINFNDINEAEGYIMGLVRDEKREISELVIVKALSMEQVATVRLPRRVPYGFHGTFVSQEELSRKVM
ncbi:hypothetical protein DITRI_Ditri15bG0062300 [Diplodiscus trichospermus]